MENITKNKYTKEDINYIFKDELRNHYLKRDFIEYKEQEANSYSMCKKDEKIEEKIVMPISKFKYKFMIKIVISLIIVVCILGYKYIQNDEIKNHKIIQLIKSEYRKDYSRYEILENMEELSKKLYSKVQNFLPEEVYNKIVNKYVSYIKPKLIEFNINNIFENKHIDNTVAVFNENNILINSDDIVKVEEVVVTSSQISLMDMDKDEILSKNINMILPVNGTVTSIYGAREEVFKNVGYHTGIDIANILNTPIKSATEGTVILAQEMDKYYGNNIEIEKDGVIFKYAHLNQINVKVGDKINQGDIIGLMGSTGASTGSHLHFEIKINGRSVDPELFLKFR